ERRFQTVKRPNVRRKRRAVSVLPTFDEPFAGRAERKARDLSSPPTRAYLRLVKTKERDMTKFVSVLFITAVLAASFAPMAYTYAALA
ncbi:MAG: hypothetical protein RIE56_08810, partial [Amphiplicatus sp.]